MKSLVDHSVLKHYLSLVIAAICFGSISVFAYYLTLLGVSSTQQAFFRILFTAIFLFCGLGIWTRFNNITIKSEHLPLFISYGLIGVCVPLFSYITAIAIGTPVIVAVSLAYLFPAITLLLARIFLKESLNLIRVFAVFCSLLGVIVISAPFICEYVVAPIHGVIVSTLTAFSLACFMVLGRKFGGYEGYNSLVTTFWAYLFGSIWMGFILLSLRYLIVNPSIDEFQLALPVHTWMLLLGFALVGTALPYTLTNYGLKRINASISSIVLLLDPISSIILGILLIGQLIEPLQLAGASLILLATLFVAIEQKSSFKEQQKRS